MEFSGFPGDTRYTPVPDQLFGHLLEGIDDLAELKCTLRTLWILHQKKGYVAFIAESDLKSDGVLLESFRDKGSGAAEAIQQALEGAIERKTLLSIPVEVDDRTELLYFLNDARGRRGIEAVRKGEATIDGSVAREAVAAEPKEPKPNIFSLYEENIGILTQLVAEQLKDAESIYPQTWIEDAFRIAVNNNKRSWSYIEAILKRRSTEGRGDGEPGRHTEKTPSQEDVKEYLRRRERGHLSRRGP